MTVGLLQIALTVLLIRRTRMRVPQGGPSPQGDSDPRFAADRNRSARLGPLAWLLLGLVIAPGALGAITVQYKLPSFVATGPLLLGMGYFGTLIYTALRTRPQPTAAELERHARLRRELGDARRWIAVACSAVFVQLLLGALVRHFGAALVCLGMPRCAIG